MPSSNNPSQSVNPSTVDPGGFGGGGGGGNGALEIHINNPSGAHEAKAISIPLTYPKTGESLLYPSGPIEGNNLLDFLARAKDAAPVPPPKLGFSSSLVEFSGVPDWDTFTYSSTLQTGLNVAMTGGWSHGTDVRFTKCLVNQSSADIRVGLYPADRGVVALYYKDDGDFLAGSTLVGAFWLGSTASRPAGLASLPSADFDNTDLLTGQPPYADSTFVLDNRLPRLHSYVGADIPPFNEDYPGHQVARLRMFGGSLSVGTTPPDYGGSYLFVHWKETFPTVMSHIDGSTLAANLTASNCYSAVPSGGNFEGPNIGNINRKHIFLDSLTFNDVTINSNDIPIPSLVSGSSEYLSGIEYFSNGLSSTGISLEIEDYSGFGGNPRGYLTGKTASPPDVPTGFESYEDPVTILPVSGSEIGIPYYEFRQNSWAGPNFSPTVAPQPSDTWVYEGPVDLAVGNGKTTRNGWSVVKVRVNFSHRIPYYGFLARQILYIKNPSAVMATSTYEPFLDERYRFVDSIDMTLNDKPVLPGIPNVWDPTTVLLPNLTGLEIGDAKRGLQVTPGNLRYPSFDYSATPVIPIGNPDYSAVFSGDTVPGGGTALVRRYIRSFDTGIPSFSGGIRIAGISRWHFQRDATVPLFDIAGSHPNRYEVYITPAGPGASFKDLGLEYPETGGCLVGEQFLGALTGFGSVSSVVVANPFSGSFTFTVGGSSVSFEDLGIQTGDTLLVLNGSSRGIYTVDSYSSGNQLFCRYNFFDEPGTPVNESRVLFELYRGKKILGTIYRYTFNESGSIPTSDNGFGEFPLFIIVNIQKQSGDTSTPTLGILEMEWVPLCLPTCTSVTLTTILSVVGLPWML